MAQRNRYDVLPNEGLNYYMQQEYERGSTAYCEKEQVKVDGYGRRCFQQQFDLISHFVVVIFFNF